MRRALPGAITLCSAALIASSCVGGGDHTVDVRIGALSAACPVPSLEVRLSVGTTICPLQRQAKNGPFEGRCRVEQTGPKIDVELDYRASVGGQFVHLARAQKTIAIAAGTDVKLSFADSELTYPDDDGDGIATIDEVCLGRDPSKKDAPTLDSADPLRHESGAIGASAQLYLVGERVELRGDNLPDAKHLEITIGPTLGGGVATVTPDSVTKTTISLRIPPGLDVSAEQTLAVEVFGAKHEAKLTVGRALLHSGVSRFATIYVYRGNYAVEPALKHVVCLPDDVANCTLSFDQCSALLYDLSADGRHLVGQCSTAQHNELFVIEVPTGKRWGIDRSLPAASPRALVLADRFLAQLNVRTGALTLRAFDGDARKLGPAGPAVTVSGGLGLRASEDGKHVYVLARNGDVDTLHRRAIIDSGATAQAADQGEKVDLGDGCPPGEAKCEDFWWRSMFEVAPGVLLLARPYRQRVERVDMLQGKISELSPQIAYVRGIAAASRGDFFYTLARESVQTNAREGVCRLQLGNLSAAPQCSFVSGTKGGITVVVPPEESVVGATFGSGGFRLLSISGGDGGLKRVPSGHLIPLSVLAQP